LIPQPRNWRLQAPFKLSGTDPSRPTSLAPVVQNSKSQADGLA